LIERLLAATPGVIKQVRSEMPAGFPALVAERILDGLADSARRLEAMPAH
jgi:serine/threonine-protein kinase HipA